jgi:hypothetical protein
MKQNLFNSNFNHDNFIEYMCLVFEDKHFKSDELRPSVLTGIEKGLNKYNEKRRKVNLFVYVTYFVKKEVTDYKKSKLLFNLSFKKR